MPLHPNVRRCTHIQITGHRCGSPALKQEYFCYFHTRMIKGVQTRVDSQIHPIALIENAEAIQSALMHMIDGVLKGTIDNQRASIVLKALYIAVRNSRNVYFHLRPDDMVRQVPNYAEQYLTEHPELNPDSEKQDQANECPPEAAQAFAKRNSATEENRKPQNQPNQCPPEAAQAFAKRSSANEENHKPQNHKPQNQRNQCHPEAAQAFAKRRPANEGPMQVPPDADAAPTTPTTANAANNGNARTGNLPKRNHEKAGSENIPPLTNRQSDRWNEIKKLEASIEGAMRGDWRDLCTVFNAVGLTPGKPPNSQKEHIVKRRCASKPTARVSTEIRPEP